MKTFVCQEDKIILQGIWVEGAPELDLRDNLAPAELMNKLKSAQGKVQVYTAEKGYKPNRCAEISLILEGGALIDPRLNRFLP